MTEIAIVPRAKLEADNNAIMASPCVFWFLLMRKITKEANITTGNENQIGAKLKTTANAKAPKAVWASPSPIMEFLRRTSETPTKLAQIEIAIPTMKALSIKEYEKISLSQLIDSS